MTAPIVLETDRHLKWPALDRLEKNLMVLCGICLTGFTVSPLVDVATREAGHALLWLQEVTSTFFTYGVFIGAAMATRINDHLFLSALTEKMSGAPRQFFEVFNRLVVLLVGVGMVWFGW